MNANISTNLYDIVKMEQFYLSFTSVTISPHMSWFIMKTTLCSIVCDFMDSFNVFKGPIKKGLKK